MYQNQNSEANTTNEPQEVITFNFSESKSPIRNIFDNTEPLFVGSDLTKALDYKNSRKALKDHCRYVTKRYILTNGGKQLMNVIPESDVYRLIMKSTLPKAQEFERWLMEDVLPSLRKQGFYGTKKLTTDFLDARAQPYYHNLINNYQVRCIEIEGVIWVSINDINKSMHSSTTSNQSAKKLNAIKLLAKKIWLFGNTNPAWFTNELGTQLLLSGSRKFDNTNQLKLNLA
jgi:prophage antirepressor-like protein